MLIVPDGIEPSEQQTIKPQVYVATGPVPALGGGYTWPVQGLITQSFSWYHPGLDIAAPYGTPLIAANSGTVDYVSTGTYDTGYGNNVWVDTGQGTRYHFAHMEAVNVSIGQRVIGGKTIIGWIGLTGRTTGPHVHFEIRSSGVNVNPLPYLQ
jgi:murein DD-endopeptidase MepM/ murein hydrolase activator NlpD